MENRPENGKYHPGNRRIALKKSNFPLKTDVRLRKNAQFY
jgi:hypothetical protein